MRKLKAAVMVLGLAITTFVAFGGATLTWRSAPTAEPTAAPVAVQTNCPVYPYCDCSLKCCADLGLCEAPADGLETGG